ncbi:hypothetical protein M2D63_017260 [Pseudomonas sp. BJa5]|uniref:hypothetical protein n=1 Tax=Pseudomonas sp. BJa5 TaxID=2936270 RepID=UPI002559A5D2|nr:hypothetical protein [Pseudomonas sp. BGr12]MDL2422870.1 hypothetical protein [Pseudomonas sp. BGr12]
MKYVVWISQHPDLPQPSNDTKQDTFASQQQAQDCAKARLLEMHAKGFLHATAEVKPSPELPCYGLENGAVKLLAGQETHG